MESAGSVSSGISELLRGIDRRALVCPNLTSYSASKGAPQMTLIR